MKNAEKILATLVSLLIVMLIFVYLLKVMDMSGKFEPEEGSRAAELIQIANPASVYCMGQGGEVDFRKDFEGNSVGYCVFSNGKECEEWGYFELKCFV
ncbi:DUF333 domain-containing protein [archaeon]|jgi:putative hemolysin|nr:DUF333 domain-containing protein [archaeon]